MEQEGQIKCFFCENTEKIKGNETGADVLKRTRWTNFEIRTREHKTGGFVCKQCEEIINSGQSKRDKIYKQGNSGAIRMPKSTIGKKVIVIVQDCTKIDEKTGEISTPI